ncbi:MAG: hypothetical protein KDH94_00455 [Coxiellaceae bacterium]|nr:hypothetical protein [Coxiellaceae bacterium]
MGLFRPEPTTIAEWQALVAEAEVKTGYAFDEHLESYLVLTLDHYTKKDELISSVIALDFLKSTNIARPRDGALLREVGDQCLILSGLFPERALKKNVSLTYFIGMGQQAYLALTDNRLKESFDPELYNSLSHNFVGLMDLLHSMRSNSEN